MKRELIKSTLSISFKNLKISRLIALFAVAGLCNLFILITQSNIRIQGLFRNSRLLPNIAEAVQRTNIAQLPEVLEAYRNPNLVFLDVREKKFYDYGHIEHVHSINIPNGKIANIPNDLIGKLKIAPAVFIYSSDSGSTLAYIAAKLLAKEGLDNVKVYANGWAEWRNCGLPITMSEQMKHDVIQEIK